MSDTKPVLNDERQRQLLFLANRVYSPAAPVDSKDLFAGRNTQVERVSEAVGTRGKHALIYGERGVGKTSLANILKDLLAGVGAIVVRVNCAHDDSFRSLWHRSLDQVQLSVQLPAFGIGKAPRREVSSLADHLSGTVSVGAIVTLCKRLLPDREMVAIFDEFDRIKSRSVKRSFADLIKSLSDNTVGTTLVLVGVARDVNTLIEEHASVDRNLVQILMPRMSPVELREIIAKADQALGTHVEHDAADLIVLLSQGLPHYTHLLAKEATTRAVLDRRTDVQMQDVNAAVRDALDKSQQSVRSAYLQAVRTPRKDSLHPQLLLACAIAPIDELGYFVSTAVREMLSTLVSREIEPSYVSASLEKFASDPSRGFILEKIGSRRRFSYRFANPLMQPFIIMKGLNDEVLRGDLLTILRKKSSEQA